MKRSNSSWRLHPRTAPPPSRTAPPPSHGASTLLARRRPRRAAAAACTHRSPLTPACLACVIERASGRSNRRGWLLPGRRHVPLRGPADEHQLAGVCVMSGYLAKAEAFKLAPEATATPVGVAPSRACRCSHLAARWPHSLRRGPSCARYPCLSANTDALARLCLAFLTS